MGTTRDFTELIKQNEGILFKITSVYAADRDAQKDLYQEVVLQLWKSFGSFRNESKVSTWLYRIALNTAITFMRKAKKKAPFIPIDQVVLEYTETKDQLFEERVKLLYEHIKALDSLEKGIVLLYMEEKSYEEIAQITGLTASNVGTRLSRIKAKLKQQMTK